MEFRPFLQHFSPAVKMLLFILIVFVSLLFTSMIGLLLGGIIFGSNVASNLPTVQNINEPGVLDQMKFFQIVSQLGMFIFPAIIFVFFVTPDRRNYLPLAKRPQAAPMLVAAAILLIALPMINWLVSLNMQMRLPASLSDVEQWMKQAEDGASKITSSFLLSGNTGTLIVNIFMIALIPAIGEELMFRGIFMRLFKEWTKNIHVAILISAFLFSAIHMQFYSFLPRFLMGVLFGYMVYWSGTLWTSILAHFVNNVVAVIVAFIAASGSPDLDFNTFGSSSHPLVILGSTLAVGLLVFFLWMRRVRTVEVNVPDSE